MEEQDFKCYEKRTQKDYSLAFKLSIVDAVEKGEMTDQSENLGGVKKVVVLQ